MIQYEHTDYDWYVEVQRRLTAKKTSNGTTYFTWCTEKMMEDVNHLIHQYVSSILTILCHGCRCGTEVNELQKLNPEAKVHSTDIYGIAYKFDRTYFREMDFDLVLDEWKGYFDVIYSNSLDHSRDPINTLLAWKSELRNGGICFVDFNWGRGVSKEDCFRLDGIDYKTEVEDISREVNMEILYVSSPYVDPYKNFYADVILRKS